ncbi:MAG: hypothetical protein M1812_007349 [Candelaria pacifica]|nr:MAG: hypothetical protein M1812_007349 [Candelaria pacifica]
MAPPRANHTGFEPRKFAASSGMPTGSKDPWARAEQWRYTGPFTRYNRFKGAFPGFGIAAAAFTVYLGYEYFFIKDDQHGHVEGGHSEGHH